MLRDSLRRTKHLLILYGYSVDQSKNVPTDLLELVMNVQEKVAELEFAGEDKTSEIIESIEPIADELGEKRTLIDIESQELKDQWDTMPSHSEPGGNIS